MNPSRRISREPVTFGYVRVSTDKQQNSLEAQQQVLAAAMAGKNWPRLCGPYCDEAVSGTIDFHDRIEAKKILLMVQPGDHVVVTHVDRLGRNMMDIISTIHKLEKMGATVHALDCGGFAYDSGSLIGTVIMAVMAFAAEMEHKRLIERTRTVIKYRRASGKRVGAAAKYGYVDDKKADQLRPHKDNYARLNTMVTLRKGGYSWRDIAAYANSQGWKAPKGGAWTSDNCRKKVLREIEDEANLKGLAG